MLVTVLTELLGKGIKVLQNSHNLSDVGNTWVTGIQKAHPREHNLDILFFCCFCDGLFGPQVVTDFDAILNDDSINCVVELMGGVTAAKDVSMDVLVTVHRVTVFSNGNVACMLLRIPFSCPLWYSLWYYEREAV